MTIYKLLNAYKIKVKDLIQNCESILANNVSGKQEIADKYSVEPMTVLRSGADELKAAEDNSVDKQYILDSLNRIFGG